MNNKLRSSVIAGLFVGLVVFFQQSANAQYGCNHGYSAGYQSYGYGYAMPLGYSGYSSYYAGYPGYSSYYSPQVYTGTSLYVSPGYYSAARVVVPAYPAYRPVVPVYRPRVMPVPAVGLRIGF